MWKKTLSSTGIMLLIMNLCSWMLLCFVQNDLMAESDKVYWQNTIFIPYFIDLIIGLLYCLQAVYSFEIPIRRCRVILVALELLNILTFLLSFSRNLEYRGNVALHWHQKNLLIKLYKRAVKGCIEDVLCKRK